MQFPRLPQEITIHLRTNFDTLRNRVLLGGAIWSSPWFGSIPTEKCTIKTFQVTVGRHTSNHITKTIVVRMCNYAVELGG